MLRPARGAQGRPRDSLPAHGHLGERGEFHVPHPKHQVDREAGRGHRHPAPHPEHEGREGGGAQGSGCAARAREEGVRDYYHVGCIGYGGNVGAAFSGILAGQDIVPLSEIANNPTRIEQRTKQVEDGAGGLVETNVRFPIWFEPVANGGTPMCLAIDRVQIVLSGWLQQHGTCFPPIVINITDGESTDGDPTSPAQGIRNLSSSDGNVLMFNAYISVKKGQVALFPSNEECLIDEYAKLLFRISDKLTDQMRSAAAAANMNLSPDARGFVFNAQIEQLIQFIEIGTGTAAVSDLR